VGIFLTLLISGLVSGAVYSVYAAGITLLYATTGIYNFAYGALAFLVDLFYYEFLAVGLDKWEAFALSVFVVAPAVGLAMEKLVFRQLAHASEVPRMVGSVGLVIALPALGYFLVQELSNISSLHLASTEYVQLVPGIGPDPAHVWVLPGGGTINSDQLIILAVGAIAALVLWVIVSRTRLGLEMRSLVDGRELARMRGISPARSSRWAWLLASLLSGVVGVVGGPLFGISATNALQFVVVSSAVVVLARFKSLPISFLGGLGLGALVSIASGYIFRISVLSSISLKIPGLSSIAAYLALFVVLLLMGKSTRRVAGVVPESPPPILRPSSRSKWGWLVTIVVFVIWMYDLTPIGSFRAGQVERTLVITGLAMTLVYLSIVVTTGLAGIVNLAPATFVTASLLVAGKIATTEPSAWGFLAALVAGTLAAIALGVIVALPSLRLGGIAFALATLALGVIGDTVLFQWPWLNNQGQGWTFNRPVIAGLNFGDDKIFLPFVAIIVALAMRLVINLQRSPSGRAILAVRNSEVAASAVGLSATKVKLGLFVVSAGLAGLGGVLLAYSGEAASSGQFPTTTGLLWLAIAVTWGVRRPASAFISGMVGSLFPQILLTGILFIPGTSNVQIPSILFGLGAIQMAKTPDGILSVRPHWLPKRKKNAATTAEETSIAQAVIDVRATAAADDQALIAVPSLPPLSASDAEGLVVRGLKTGYDDLEVIHGVDLAVAPGSVLALVGLNGAGKTTLCKALAGLLPHAGVVTVRGMELGALSAEQRSRHGLVLAPEGRGIFPNLTVEENLEVLLPKQAQRDQVCERHPILAARRKTPAGSLSGGEQQLLALAGLLATRPAVIMADEPTLGLAPRIAREVLALFVELRELGTAVLLVEEKAHLVAGVADYLLSLKLGRVAWYGPADSVSEEEILRSYLGEAPLSIGSDGAPVPIGSDGVSVPVRPDETSVPVGSDEAT
jgi:ABC-type branched-subunit amino acid transport system ATPase component/branched-subunit amino acid ABC-type transport system permease component